jgi:4-amino-4-deoxy-L-arabinose transferase-like glycosyltransferase
MKKDISILRLPDIGLFLMLVLLAMGVRFLYFFKTGVAIGGDSGFYKQLAGVLVDSGFNYLKLTMGVYKFITNVPVFYWGYPTVLAVFYQMFGNNDTLVVVFQILLSSICIIPLYKTAEILFNRDCGIISAAIYIFSWELFRWDVYILTDSVALSVSIIMLYFVTRYIEKPSLGMSIPAIMILVIAFFVRPTMIVYITVAFIFLISKLLKKKTPLTILILVFLVLFGVLVYFILKGSINVDIYVTHYINQIKSGWVISGMPDHRIDISQDFDKNHLAMITGIASMVVRRWLAFWYIFVHEFSTVHKLINFAYLAPIYAFCITAIISSIRNKMLQKISFILAIALSFSVFHAFTEVDFDWRYRIPVLPGLIVLSSFGIYTFLKTMFRNNIRRN